MTWDNVIFVMFRRFPDLEIVYSRDFYYMGEAEPSHYLAFGGVLIPALEQALARSDAARIQAISEYLEEVAVASEADSNLADLIRIEVGEWLDSASHGDVLQPWLGQETKRLCGYVSGLGMQRRKLALAPSPGTPIGRFSAWVRRWWVRRL